MNTPITDLCAITLDVDGANCYRAIHGLPAGAGPDPIFSHALPRFFELLDDLRAPATLFVVGRDLADDEARAAITRFVDAGHEIASHSYAHDYRLSQQPRAVIDADLARADDAIAAVAGAPPVGFRAPGYNLSEVLCDALDARGYRYDSSLFPTPAYFALRGAALGSYRVRRRPSHSLLGDVREFAATRRPFFPSTAARYRRGGPGDRRRYLEIPISTPRLFPWLGTTLSMLPTPAGRALSTTMAHARHPVVLELHAIDFADRDDGYEPALIEAQPDLQLPAATKVSRLRASIEALCRRRHPLRLRDFPAV